MCFSDFFSTNKTPFTSIQAWNIFRTVHSRYHTILFSDDFYVWMTFVLLLIYYLILDSKCITIFYCFVAVLTFRKITIASGIFGTGLTKGLFQNIMSITTFFVAEVNIKISLKKVLD